MSFMINEPVPGFLKSHMWVPDEANLAETIESSPEDDTSAVFSFVSMFIAHNGHSF